MQTPLVGPLASPSPGAQKALTAHYERIMKSPGVEDVWQVHRAMLDQEANHNTAPDQIANVEETADCKGNWIRASVAPDGKFTITNGRNGYSKTYVARGSGS